MNIPIVCRIFGTAVDERFMEHRRRSTSLAGIIAALVAIGIFEYRLLHDHIWSWDVLSIALTFAVIKMSMMVWYRFKG
jgi:hypothetical protein